MSAVTLPNGHHDIIIMDPTNTSCNHLLPLHSSRCLSCSSILHTLPPHLHQTYLSSRNAHKNNKDKLCGHTFTRFVMATRTATKTQECRRDVLHVQPPHAVTKATSARVPRLPCCTWARAPQGPARPPFDVGGYAPALDLP